MFDYRKICQNLLKNLPQRQREVLLRRFALQARATDFSREKRETLESIGRDFDITKERVRQIEEDGLLKITPKLKEYQKVFQYFKDQLKATGNLRKEEILLWQLGKEKYQPHIFFLLTLAEPFKRFAQTEEFHSLWTINPNSFEVAQKVIHSFWQKLTELKRPLNISEYRPSLNVSSKILEYFLEISKIIQKNQEGFYGLESWPEINPKTIKDKAFLVFKKTGKPLHFRQVAELIGTDVLSQTVHNELIRDPRFVLVGRGLYALKEWGFEEGYVKDIILKVLKMANKPLAKEEILEKVLKQRLVKENTILLNLANKKYFLKTPAGKYIIHPGLSSQAVVQKS